MAPSTRKNAANAKRVSPTQSDRSKRERSDDEEEETRRVSQRTNAEEDSSSDEAAGAKATMDELVLKGLLSNDEDNLEETLDKICNLLYDSKEETMCKEAQNDFCQLGGHVAAVRVMEKHLGCAKIQVNGAYVLMSASREMEYLRNGIGRVGGIQAILAAMKKHSKNENLIFFAMISLYNVTFTEANAELFISKTDGVSLVLKCMKTFADVDKIVFEACDLFHSLCKHDQLRSKLDDANVGMSLMAVYSNKKGNEKTREIAKDVMKLLLE